MSSDIVLGDGALRIAYEKQGDRYAHRILFVDSSGDTTLLESVESAEDVPWPDSPPLQDFEIEPRGSSEKVALLVGMAGTSHWSASVEVQRGQLHFDIACRLRHTPSQLGSTYQVRDAKISEGNDGAFAIHSADGKTVELTPHQEFSTQVELLEDNRVWIGPENTETELPATVRWQYSLRFADSPN